MERRLEVEAFRYTVRHHADEWKEFLSAKPTEPIVRQHKWEKPPSNMVKINVDAAFAEQRRVGGWGLICRDDAQHIRFAAAEAQHDLHSALQAEAVALSKA